MPRVEAHWNRLSEVAPERWGRQNRQHGGKDRMFWEPVGLSREGETEDEFSGVETFKP